MSRKQELLSKILLTCSWPIFGLFMTITDDKKYILLNSIFMFAVVMFLMKKIKFKKIDDKKFIISCLLSCYTDRLFLTLFSDRIIMFRDFLIMKTGIEYIRIIFYTFVSIAIFPTIVFCIYRFIDQLIPLIIREFKTMTKIEKKFLIIVLIISTIFSVGTSLVTSAFQIPVHGNNKYLREVIYTADNGKTCEFDGWMNLEYVENDIRQPLFAVFSFPIAIPAHIVSELLFFIPGDFSYYTLMSIIQYFLLAITTILIARLLKIRDDDKKYLYCLFTLSFPYVLFGLVLEQYVISLFYVITTIYYFYQGKDKINYLYLGAVGTLVTSGVLLPFLSKYTTFKDWIKKVVHSFICFFCLFILSGQFAQIFTLADRVKLLSQFTGVNLGFSIRMNQFTNFIESIFLSPTSEISKRYFDFGTYQQVEPKTISIIGIIIFSLILISFIINRKNRIALISFCWILFSFFVLVVVGWGIAENGQILYGLYFAWAYYILFFMLINKIRNRKIFRILITFSIIIIFISMSIEMNNILKYAIKFFPR